MERSEPSLVPEWLRSSGISTGNGTTTHPHSASVLLSDDHAVSKLGRNKSALNHNDRESGRSSASDRTSSSYFRQSSSSNDSCHLLSYGSFGRNSRSIRSRDWDKDPYGPHDRKKSFAVDPVHRDYLDSPFLGDSDTDRLRRSQSMISGKSGEASYKRSISHPNTASKNKSSEGNGLLDKGNSGSSMHKSSFEREFPSLGSEERQPHSEIGRIPSPVLSNAIHGLPISCSPMVGADKWTSVLAEVPAMVGSTSNDPSSGQPALPSGSAPLTLSTSTGLNMAEAVSQSPQCAQIAPKISTGTQRLEELAIRQSRQLIPMTPSMPKPLVLNPSDKGKGKAGQQQHPTPLLSPPFRGGPVKADAMKTGNAGKLQVLKPARERNGGSCATKDNLSPTTATKSTTSAASVAGLVPSRGTANTPISPSADGKHVLPVLEKRPSSQTQSRNDFFNLVRKKSQPNPSAVQDTRSAVLPSSADEHGDLEIVHAPEGGDDPLLDVSNVSQITEDNINLTLDAEVLCGEGNLKNGKNHATSHPLFSEEEEAAFLHKLGWQENADEGALTKEEIDAFCRDFRKYLISKPSAKNLQMKFPMLLSTQVGAVSSGLSSSDSDGES